MEKPPQDLREQWKNEQEQLKDIKQPPVGLDEEPDPLGIKASYEEDTQTRSVFEESLERVDDNFIQEEQRKRNSM